MNPLARLLCLLCAAAISAAAQDTRAAAQKIDALLAADWQRHGLQPNPPASDELFVRRIYLDAAGRIPSAREAAAFLADTAPDKRAKLIDTLLASEGHALHFFS